MTRALLRTRTETKLLAQAAADKVAASPSVTDAQIKAQYDPDNLFRLNQNISPSP